MMRNAIWIVNLCVVLASGVLADTSWLQGCFHGYLQDSVSSQLHFSLVPCARHCLESGAKLVGLNKGENCTCLNDTSALQQLDKNHCEERCVGFDHVWLPCGGADRDGEANGVWSVYSASGPYLVQANATVAAAWVVTGTPVTLEASALLANFVNLTSDCWDAGGWQDTLLFVWDHAGTKVEANVTACGPLVQAHAPFTFTRTGNFTVDLTVSNVVSTLHANLSLTVLLPCPRGLQVMLRPRPRRDVPSCTDNQTTTTDVSDHDSSCTDSGGGQDDDQRRSVVAVFTNSTFQVEASVITGANLTFVFVVAEESSRRFVNLSNAETASCQTSDCRLAVQTFQFLKKGVYTILANVSNQYGWSFQSLVVVVVDRRLEGLYFSPREATVAPPRTFQLLTFQLALETTDRENAHIIVNFGDGQIKRAMLGEFKTATVTPAGGIGEDWLEELSPEDNHEIEGLQLIASYEEGCKLAIEFEHQYVMEGEFVPQATVYNDFSLVDLPLSAPLVLQNQLSGAKMEAPASAAAGTSVEILLTLLTSSLKMTVNWIVWKESDEMVMNTTSNSSQLALVFDQIGTYRVRASASNALSSVDASTAIQVQEALQELTLQCDPNPPHLTIEGELTCRAFVAKGSHVTFEWNFREESSETEIHTDNLISVASHVYATPGVYNVSVMASNEVSRLVAKFEHSVMVNTPVRCLCLNTSGPVSPHEDVFLWATALGGTAIKFEFDFGSERRAYEHTEREQTKTKVEVTYSYPRPGRHTVTIFAHNPISSVILSTQIVVQPRVGHLELSLQPACSLNNTAVVLVMENGKLTERQDLVFYLQSSDGPSILSRSPVLDTKLSYDGKLSVNFTAFNEVDRVRREHHLKASAGIRDRVGAYLVHDAVVQQHQQIFFQLLNCPKDVQNIRVNYSDGTNHALQTGNNNRWSHVFTSPGVHTLEVALYGGFTGGAHRDRPTLHSFLVVEEPITGLRLAGPTHVGIFCHNVWKALLSNGSHVVCQWSLGGEMVGNNRTVFLHMEAFDTPGIYTLGVKCHNDISSMLATLNITVNYPVADAHVTIPVTVHGKPTMITIVVYAGHHFTLHIDFGDGTAELIESKQLRLVSVTPQLPPWRESVPANSVTLLHTYAVSGEYNVNVIVSNTISSLTRHKRAVVQEAIGGIQLSTSASGIVMAGDTVNFTAVVASGRNLELEWDFSDNTHHSVFMREGNTATITHIFDASGEYSVMVKVRNHLQKEPVIARLPDSIVVQEAIKYVSLKQLSSKSGVDFDIATNRSADIHLQALSNGAPVMFIFYFGDGNTREVNGEVVSYPFATLMSAQALHYYDREGAFNVSVMAKNALGSLTAGLPRLLYVQVPVRGPLLAESKYCTHLGEETELITNPIQGTNVTYTWRLDDQTELVNTVASVRHKYRQTGVKTIQVIAINQVSSVTSYADVEVVEQVQSVTVSVESQVVAAGKSMIYTANVMPQQLVSHHYNWDFSKTNETTLKNSISYTYSHSGKFRVTVTAHNCYSSATSIPIEVHVVALLQGLQIQTSGDILVGKDIKFSALTYEGDYLNFTWNFGDNSPSVTTEDTQIVHSYNRNGEYIVTLWAENPLSNDSVMQRIFVLNRICKPPIVDIVGFSRLPGDEMEVMKWKAIRIESQVTVNCSITSNLKYSWSVKSLNDSVAPSIDSTLLMHPFLLLPPHTLQLGHYLVTLKVSISGTEIPVYHESHVKLHVKKSPLESIITGGAIQLVNRNANITLDGSTSRDPDNETTSFSYNWTCVVQKYTSLSCFNTTLAEDILLYFNRSKFTIPAAWFRTDQVDFLFSLTVTAPFNITPSTSTQVVSLSPNSYVPVTLECKHCYNGWVNSNAKVTLVARCMWEACNKLQLQYSWEVSQIASGNPDSGKDQSIDIHSGCVASDGSSYSRLIHALTNTSATTPTTHVTTPTTMSTTTQTLTHNLPLRKPVNTIPEFPFLESWPNLIEDPGPKTRLDSRSRSRGHYTAERNSGSHLGDLPFEIEEGTTGNSGNPPGRNWEYYSSNPREQTLDSKENRTSSIKSDPRCVDFDCLRFETIQSLQMHLLDRDRQILSISSSNTSSEPNGPSLVLLPKTLTEGLIYLVQVIVTSPDAPEMLGQARMFLRVGKSPRKGACSVLPPSGVEMKTLFKVFCKEWQDEQTPLWYEVSYSLGGSDPRHIIYHGLSHEITFRLPAGDKVLLYLVVADNWGAATDICHIPIHVLQANNSNAYNDSTIKQEVDTLFEHLSSPEPVYHADISRVQDPCDALSHLAILLNQRPAVNVTARADIRMRLVKTLKLVPLRDQVELIKTLHCLVYITLNSNEVNVATLLYEVWLLESIGKHARAVFVGEKNINDELLALVLQVTSNLIRATSAKDFSNSLLKHLQEYTHRALEVVNIFLSLALQNHALGEKPVIHEEDFMSMFASHYSTLTPNTITISTTTFQIPTVTSLIAKAVGKTLVDVEQNHPCFQARLTAFRQNPFKFALHHSAEVQSEVASLDIYTCDGQSHIVIKDLSPSNSVEIILPHTNIVRITAQRFIPTILRSETGQDYQLSRSRVSIHQFNVSPAQEDRFLTLLVTLAPITNGSRPFPVTAIISQQRLPHLQNNLLWKDFPLEANELRFFLPPGSLKGPGTYYLSLLETSLNSGRRRKTELSTRNYALDAWSESCLHWSNLTMEWRNEGCYVLSTTMTKATHCRCNHLTLFGSHFELIPNDLSFTDVENFFNPHENPVVLVLIAVVFTIYAVLLVFAYRADKHDHRKGGLVCLTDNSATDTQLYEIVTVTGLCQSSANTAKISIILHGEIGMSETRELFSEDGRPMFECNSYDRFLLTLPDNLGKIMRVQIWHNNAGPFPRWYLSQLVIRDLNLGNVYYFLCDKWFAVDEGDGRIERELVALDNVVRFTDIIFVKGRQYISDFHLWASLLTCPPCTRFTRAQRLTCCLTLLLSYMALNAMWYQQQPDQPRGEFGLLDLSLRNITVGAMCWLLVFPVNLFLTFLFRRSRVSRFGCDHKADTSKPTSSTVAAISHQASGTVSIDSSGTGGGVTTDTVTSLQTITTYSLLDQSILNWQSIQDWAQRQWVKRQHSNPSSAISVKNSTQQSTQPCPTRPVQHTLLAAGDETDQTSSGFEDAVSQVTAERHRIKAASDSSSEGRHSHIGDGDTGGWHILLPAWCRYLAWILCALICTGCTVITILYGFRFGPTKSTFWLQSLYFSFMICVFIGQPFWIIVTVFLVALRNRNNPSVLDHFDISSKPREGIDAWHSRQKHIQETQEEGQELERGVRARQRSRYLRFARPPNEKELHESRKNLIKQKNAANFIRDLGIFVMMFTLVCIIAYGKDISSAYRLNRSLDTLLVRNGPLPFNNIRNVTDWHRWAQSTLLNALFGTYSMEGFVRKGGINNSSSILIGHPHIRQLRIGQQSCSTHQNLTHPAPALTTYDNNSSSAYGQPSSECKNGHYWSPPPYGGVPILGQVSVYDAGGFVVAFNHSSKEKALSHLQTLEASGWIDEKTKAVVVELTVLNVPTNFFSSVVLLLELPQAGGVILSRKITSTCLFRYVTAWDNFVLACELLFILVGLACLQKELASWVRLGWRYFACFWNYTQMAFCVVAMIYIMYYIYRFVLLSDLVEHLRSTFFEQFVSLVFISSWDESLQALKGLLVFMVVSTRGLQLTQCCSHMAKFSFAYRRANHEIISIILVFSVVVIAFSGLGTGLFGTLSYNMRSLRSSSMAVMVLMTGTYRSPELADPESPWFCIFAMFFQTFGVGFIVAYAVAVLTRRLHVYKSSDMQKFELLKYCKHQLLVLLGIRKVVPVQEPEVDLPPECTLAEFEYQVEELLFRMNALAGTTNLPEKPAGYLTDSDRSQAVGDDGISSGESEPEQTLAVTGSNEDRLEQRVQKIEDKLYSKEPYLAQLLKLDSIGADVLSQEKEKQIRSHLELEIFRQLQMRRQEVSNALPGLVLTPAVNVTSTFIAGNPRIAEPVVNGQAIYLKSSMGICPPHSYYAEQSPFDSHIVSAHTVTTSLADCPDMKPVTEPIAKVSASTQGGSMDKQHLGHNSKLRNSGDSGTCTSQGTAVLPNPGPDNETLSRAHSAKTESELSSRAPKTTCEGTGSKDITQHPADAGTLTPGNDLLSKQLRVDIPPLGSDQVETVHGGRKKIPNDTSVSGVERTDSVHGTGKVQTDSSNLGMARTDSLHKSCKKPIPGNDRADSLRTSGKKSARETPSAVERSDSLRATVLERADSLRTSGKRHIKEAPSSAIERADSLRASGKRHTAELSSSGVVRTDSLRNTVRKPELPPKPTYVHSLLPALEARHSPKPPPLKLNVERAALRTEPGVGGMGWRGETGGNNLMGESSSGSEQDAANNSGGIGSGGGSRRMQGQGRRNLRKTKSRGKGKGAGTLSPTLLLDELSLTVHQLPQGSEECMDQLPENPLVEDQV